MSSFLKQSVDCGALRVSGTAFYRRGVTVKKPD